MSQVGALSLKVILGSTREGRFGDKPAHWMLGEASKLPGVEVDLLDLRNFPLPFFNRPLAPIREGGTYPDPAVTRWAEQIRHAIHIPVEVYLAAMKEPIPPNPEVFAPLKNNFGDRVAMFFDDLLWAARALKTARGGA